MGKVMRYLFIIIVIAIVGFAIYKGIESKNKEKKEELKENRTRKYSTKRLKTCNIRIRYI